MQAYEVLKQSATGKDFLRRTKKLLLISTVHVGVC